MTYTLHISNRAERDLTALPQKDRLKIIKDIDNLAKNPNPPGSKHLKGKYKDYCRIRVGDYRIIYKIERKAVVIIVIRIGHRREIYQRL